MKRFILTNVIVLIFMTAAIPPISAHTYQVPMIIDTDAGIDDLRAIILLVNSGMADIRLVITSDGAASPAAGQRNIEILFSLMNQNVRVSAGRALDAPAPPWRQWTENVFLSHKNKTAPEKSEGHTDTLVTTLREVEGQCIYLCLGPLTNLGDALNADTEIKDKISRLVYFGTVPGDNAGWNTGRDLDAARRVFASGLKTVVLDSPGFNHLPFDAVFFRKITAMDTPASRLFITLHSQPAARERINNSHFRIWDESASIYLNNPGLFRFHKKDKSVSIVSGYESESLYANYLMLLGHSADTHLQKRDTVILKKFPVAPGEYKSDLSPLVKKIIERYGLEEWKACVLTNELHRHLGLYSIIGAKMGIRARELLGAPADSIRVVSYAGLNPPLSCMNDGLQVSTGASLGRGSIKVDSEKPLASATFTYEGDTVTLTLKKNIVHIIRTEIARAIEKHGAVTPEYFRQVRQLSIRSWYEWDREEIFHLIEN